jgi:hypothetical protein
LAINDKLASTSPDIVVLVLVELPLQPVNAPPFKVDDVVKL